MQNLVNMFIYPQMKIQQFKSGYAMANQLF